MSYKITIGISLAAVLLAGCNAAQQSTAEAPAEIPTNSVPTPTLPVPDFAVKPPTQEGHIPRTPLNTEICDPPCWQGITPDVSTEADVRQVFAQHHISCSSVQDDSGVNCDGIWIPIDGDTGRVEFIAFNLLEGSVSTLGEIVDQYGEPDQV